MKKSTAVQMFEWLEEFKRLQTKQRHSVLSQRELYRLEDLQVRLKQEFSRHQTKQEDVSETPEDAPKAPIRPPHARAPLRETTSQSKRIRQQAIVTKHDSFSSLPFVAMRQLQEQPPSNEPTSNEYDSLPDSNPARPGVLKSPTNSHTRLRINTDKAHEDETGDFSAFELFHPPESLKK